MVSWHWFSVDWWILNVSALHLFIIIIIIIIIIIVIIIIISDAKSIFCVLAKYLFLLESKAHLWTLGVNHNWMQAPKREESKASNFSARAFRTHHLVEK